MSTIIYVILAVVTLSGILYSVTSSMDSAKNNLNIISNIKKGDEIFSVLKNTVTLNSDMEIVIPMPDKNKVENPIVPSWVYGDTQNSFGDDFIYCPFLTSENLPSQISTVDYKSENDDYSVIGYGDQLLAGREYALSASKNLLVNGENVIFAIATSNKKAKDVSCDDIFVSGKKLRVSDGKVWFFTDKSLSQRGNVLGGNAVLFVSADESQLLKGNMSGLDKFNPTSVSSALSNIVYGKYSDIRIKFYDGKYLVPSGFTRIGYDKNGYELTDIKITFEPLIGGDTSPPPSSVRDYGVEIIPESNGDELVFNNTSVSLNNIKVSLKLDVSNGDVKINNAEVYGLETSNSKNSAVRNSLIGFFNAVNSDMTFSDNVTIKMGVDASNTNIYISSRSSDYLNNFIVGSSDGSYSSGINIKNNSSLTIKDSSLDVISTESDYFIRAADSSVGIYGASVTLRKIGGGTGEGFLRSNGDVSISKSYLGLSDATVFNVGINMYGGAKLRLKESSLFTYGAVPKIGVIDDGISFMSGEDVRIKPSETTGICWSGPVFTNSGSGLSSPVKPEIDDGYYNHIKMINKSSWQCW